MTEEGIIKKDIADFCELAGCVVFRMNAGKVRQNVAMSPKGTPDLLVITRTGWVVWIEVKKPGEKPTAVQLEMHEKLQARGQTVVVACGLEDLPDLRRL